MKRVLLLGIVLVAAIVGFGLAGARAQEDRDFGLQVTPSPLVTTVEPGSEHELEVKIRNSGTASEQLKIEPRAFKIKGEEIELEDDMPPDIGRWVSFSAPTFTIEPGQWFTQKVKLVVPKEAGFSYSFVLLVSRKDIHNPIEGGRVIRGAVAIFTLVNVDRPGAVRKLDVAEFSVGKRMYEYLPADLIIQFKNSGNTIVQPYGNIFIQRSAGDKTPITILPVNETKGYLLPDNTRTLKSQWTNGFPAYTTVTDEQGHQQKKLTWNWSKLSELRIGRYTAKLVAVYNDGTHDVPLEGHITFWVFPWKIIGVLLIFLILLLFGLYSLARQIIQLVHRRKKGDGKKYKAGS